MALRRFLSRQLGPLMERTLKALGRPAWEVTPEDIDRVVGDLAVQGRETSTRREYVQIFKGFHRSLQAGKAAEIEAAFGGRLVCLIDEFNASRHVGDDPPTLVPPPTAERVGVFFEFMKQRIATARKCGPAARDYANVPDAVSRRSPLRGSVAPGSAGLHFTRGPFGKLHFRFGEGAHVLAQAALGAHARRIGLVLRWFLEDVWPTSPDSTVLFADESVGPLHRGTISNRLRYLMQLEGRPVAEWFSPHSLDYEIHPALGHLHRGRLSAGGRHGASSTETRVLQDRRRRRDRPAPTRG